MPVIILLIIAVIYGVAHVTENYPKNDKAFTYDELRAMNRESVGKSRKECEEIVKRYSKK